MTGQLGAHDETAHDGDEIEPELADAAAAAPPADAPPRRAMIEWPGGARS